MAKGSKKQGKINPIFGIVILIAGIAAICGIVLFSMEKSKDIPRYFHLNRNAKGNLLYNQILEYDLENNYPESAEEVMNLNSLIMNLYYGKIISNNELIEELVDIQRKIFHDSLLEKNSAKDQYNNIISSCETLFEQNVYIFQIDQGVAFYSQQNDMCIIPITTILINYERVYWNYYLRLDEQGRWKIYSWERTDKYFRPLEEE